MRCKFSFDHFRDDQRLSGYSGLHGYTHEFVAELNEKQERDVLKKSVEVLTAFTGKKPKGWTAPAWATSKNSIKLLEEFGIVSIGCAACPVHYLTTLPGVRSFHDAPRLPDVLCTR